MADKILTNFMYDRYYSEYKTSAIRKFIPIAFTKKEKYLESNGWYWTRTPYKPPYNPRNKRQIWYVEYNGSLNFRVIVPIIRLKIDE